MRCNEVEALLAELISGEISTDGAAGVQQHLRSCAACDRELQSLRQASELLQAGKLPSEIAHQRAAQISLEFAERPSVVGGRYAGALAMLKYAAVIIVSFGAGYLLRPSQSVEKTQPAETNEAAPVIAQRYEAANRTYPKAAAMSKGLLALANVDRNSR